MCKDVLCCGIFLGFIGFLLFIFYISIAAGDWQAVLYGADYMGNRCGTDGLPQKAFYPRIPKDLAEQPAIVASQQYWNLELYALCVDECPTGFDIANPTSEHDYGWTCDPGTTPATYANGASSCLMNNPTTVAIGATGSMPFWISATPTSEVLNRCVPRIEEDSKEATMCAYPDCHANTVIANGGVCLTGDQAEDFGPAWMASTPAQKALCIVEAKQTKTIQYQVAAESDASAAALASIAGVIGGFFEVVTSLREGIYLILGFGILAPIAVSVLYMVLLYLFTKTIIYGLLVLLVFVLLIATFICFARSGIAIAGLSGEDLIAQLGSQTNQTLPDDIGSALGEVGAGSTWIYTAGFWILLLITVITSITIVLWRKKIAICASIIKEATTVFKDVPTLLLFPIFTSAVQILVCAYFVLGLILLRTTKAESYDLVLSMNTTAVDPIDGFLRDISDSGNAKMFFILVHLYGFYVMYQWVGGMSWTTMSMTTGWWYYFKGDKENSSRFPLGRSLFLVTVFHTGSVAFAAFIIAIFDLLRTIVEYIRRQMAATGQNSTVVKIAFCCIGCCINCIQKTVKMISYYGLVFVATNGNSFCYACMSTAKFFVKHAGQVTVNGIVIYLIKMISVLTAPIACAIIGFYACDSMGVANPMYPGFAIFCCAVLMTSACMNVFDCTITTIFVCCFEDQEKYDSQYMLQPHHKALASVFNKKGKAKGKEEATKADPEKDKLVTA